MEVAKVENLVSKEGERFEGIRQWAKVNVLWICQSPLSSEKWVQMVFMGCIKNIISLRWCLYWWWVYSFSIHCESGCSRSQLDASTLDHIVSSTWKCNSVHFTKLVWWWDVGNFSGMRDPLTAQWSVLQKMRQLVSRYGIKKNIRAQFSKSSSPLFCLLKKFSSVVASIRIAHKFSSLRQIHCHFWWLLDKNYLDKN